MLQSLIESFQKAGQEHVFADYNNLSEADQETLVENLLKIDIERAVKILERANSAPSNTQATIEPVTADSIDDPSFYFKRGLKAISQSKVAVILLAGGQGTRLGSSDPKGMFNIGLPSQKSLFQLQAERILSVINLAKTTFNIGNVSIPWYIMTSEPTRSSTESFFVKNKYFGFPKSDIFFFNQGVLPAFDSNGKVFMESKVNIVTAPGIFN